METSGGSVVQEMRFVTFKPIWITFHACFRYADSGDIAAIIKHKVEDGKMSVTLECGDIVCNSTYVKI